MSHLRREFSGASDYRGLQGFDSYVQDHNQLRDNPESSFSFQMDELNRIVEQATSADPTINIEEIFRCYICMGRVRNAQMCPSCSKMCCMICIEKWLKEQRPQCPHCRCPLRVSQLVNCRFVAELSAELDKLQTIQKHRVREICKIHNANLYYFCKTCTTPICSDCAMFSEQHKGHQFEHLNAVYDTHVEAIRKEAGSLQKRLKDLFLLMQGVEENIQKVTKTKEDYAGELRLMVEQMQGRLDAQLKSKLLVLLAQKGSISEEVELLESMLNELNRQITNNPKSVLISKSAELVRMLQELHRKPTSQFVQEPVSLDFESEITPKYDMGVFQLKNYNKMKQTSEVVYSDPLHASGLTWRLKVYPNGNGVARGTFLSVFLEMLRGYPEPSKYEYRVEMVNHKGSQSVVREFASDFEVGECWGYNRFYRIDYLSKEGYLRPEEDTIILNFYVRATTYRQQSRDQKRYIEQLELARSQAALQIADLKRKLADSGKAGPEGQPSTSETIISEPHVREKDELDMKKDSEELPTSLENMDRVISQSADNLQTNKEGTLDSTNQQDESRKKTYASPSAYDAKAYTPEQPPRKLSGQINPTSLSAINQSGPFYSPPQQQNISLATYLSPSPRLVQRPGSHGVPALVRQVSDLTPAHDRISDSQTLRRKGSESSVSYIGSNSSTSKIVMPVPDESIEEKTPRLHDNSLTRSQSVAIETNVRPPLKYLPASLSDDLAPPSGSPRMPPNPTLTKYTEDIPRIDPFISAVRYNPLDASVSGHQSDYGDHHLTEQTSEGGHNVTDTDELKSLEQSIDNSYEDANPYQENGLQEEENQVNLATQLDRLWRRTGETDQLGWQSALNPDQPQHQQDDDNLSEDLAALGQSLDIGELGDESSLDAAGSLSHEKNYGDGIETSLRQERENGDDESDRLSNIELYHKVCIP
eukprot:TRINITY_DN4707_c0_g2_i2.p1 TRINITY_DN4707_c0_g2~~TRINITY_DN4707_c0_g2_i2.p1  ORF type:complete len:931 (-),score=180.40 TRINITY_DN4707_c0_g2_i2:331-3123(-)